MPVFWYHTLVIQEDGTTFSCGKNDKGQLGTGTNDEYLTKLTPIRAPVKFRSVAPGFRTHSVAVAEDGSLWGWGDNANGQIGLSNVPEINIPTLILSNENQIQSVVAGSEFSMALNITGGVWVFGSNAMGELGLGDTESRRTPVLNPFLENIKIISAGLYHGVAVSLSNQVWSWGCNTQGNLGLGDTLARDRPCLISTLNGIEDCSTGYYHSLLLDNHGRVWCFGDNEEGQLGLGDEEKRDSPVEIISLRNIAHVWAGGNSSYVQDNSGTVWVFGSDSYGQLGLGNGETLDENQDFEDAFVPILTPVEQPKLKNADIVAGGDILLAVNEQGCLSTCGYNYYGQLSHGDTIHRNTLTSVPDFVVHKRISPVKSARTE